MGTPKILERKRKEFEEFLKDKEMLDRFSKGGKPEKTDFIESNYE